MNLGDGPAPGRPDTSEICSRDSENPAAVGSRVRCERLEHRVYRFHTTGSRRRAPMPRAEFAFSLIGWICRSANLAFHPTILLLHRSD